MAGFGGKGDVEKVGLELVKFSSDLYQTFGRCDSSEKVDKTSRDITEQQYVPEEDEILFIGEMSAVFYNEFSHFLQHCLSFFGYH